MHKDKRWMLMTYYCPTHGNLGRIEPVELPRNEISKNLARKSKSQANLD